MGYKKKTKQLVEEMEPLIEELHELEWWHKEYKKRQPKLSSNPRTDLVNDTNIIKERKEKVND